MIISLSLPRTGGGGGVLCLPTHVPICRPLWQLAHAQITDAREGQTEKAILIVLLAQPWQHTKTNVCVMDCHDCLLVLLSLRRQ